MNLLIKKFDENVYILKLVISGERNIKSIIAGIKMIILENPEKKTILDLRKVNFLDTIKIGTIIGTYHFLGFSEKKIYLMVNDEEMKKSLEKLSFDNIKIHVGYDKVALEGIA